MKKAYSKPEINANAYAEFENVLTFACTKQFFGSNVSPNGCHAHPEIGNSGGECPDGDKLSGQSDHACKKYSSMAESIPS